MRGRARVDCLHWGLVPIVWAAGCVGEFPGLERVGNSDSVAESTSEGASSSEPSAVSRGDGQESPADGTEPGGGASTSAAAGSTGDGEDATTSSSTGVDTDLEAGTTTDSPGPVTFATCEGETIIDEFAAANLNPRWNSWTSPAAQFELSETTLRFLLNEGTEAGDSGIETLGEGVNVATGFAQIEIATVASVDSRARLYLKLSKPSIPCEDNAWIENGSLFWRNFTTPHDPAIRWLRWRGGEAGELHFEGSTTGETWIDLFEPQTPACDLGNVRVHVYSGAIETLQTPSSFEVETVAFCEG